MKPSLSIVIPAFNEEKGLSPTVNLLTGVLDRLFDDYELLIINDSSRDRTGQIAAQLASTNCRIRALHNAHNMGLGFSYRKGIQAATKDFVWWIPGDGGGLQTEDDLVNILRAVGHADMVLVYLLSENRPKYRQLISRTYTGALNLMFGLRLKYFNGANVYRRTLLQSLPLSSNGHGLLAEISVQMAKRGAGYVEIGMHNREPSGGNANALRLKNLIQVVKVLLRLYWKIQIMGIGKANPKTGKPVRPGSLPS